MIPVLIDALAVIAGGSAGLFLNDKINQKLAEPAMMAIGIYLVYLGIANFNTDCNGIIVLVSLSLGAIIGTRLDIDGKSVSLVRRAQEELSWSSDAENDSRSLVDFFLISCTGAYVFLAAFEAASGKGDMFYAKAVIDLVVSFMFAASKGKSVIFSSIPIFIYQILLVICAGALTALMDSSMIAILSCIGGLITVSIGTNMMKITDIKLADMLPALVLAPMLQWIVSVL